MNLKIKYLILFIIIPFNIFALGSEKILSMIENGSIDEAVTILEKYNSSKKEKAFLYYRAGESFFLKNQYNKALKAFKSAEKDFDEKKLINWNLGLTCFAIEDYTLALKFFDKFKIKEIEEDKALLIIKSAFFAEEYKKVLNLIDKKEFKNKKKEVLILKIKALIFLKKYEKGFGIINSLLKDYPLNPELIKEKIRIKNLMGYDNRADIYLLGLINDDGELNLKILNNINSPALRSLYFKDRCLIAKELFLTGSFNKSLYLLKKNKCKNNFDTIELKAKLYFLKGEYIKSGNLYLKAADLKDNKEKFYFLAGKSFFMGESFKRSKKYLKMASIGIGKFSLKSKKILSYLE